MKKGEKYIQRRGEGGGDSKRIQSRHSRGKGERKDRIIQEGKEGREREKVRG